MDKRIVNAIAIVVTTVWALSFVADVLLPQYNPNPYIGLIMMSVVGAIFGKGVVDRWKGKTPNNGNSLS